jgi:hypothetical protein
MAILLYLATFFFLIAIALIAWMFYRCYFRPD